MPYLESIAEFCRLSPFNEAQAAELELKRPGWLAANIQAVSEYIDARMRKRGDVPFLSPYPGPVRMWVAWILTPLAFDALGRRPSDDTQESISERAKLAEAQIIEAADPVKGLLVLPLQRNGAAPQATEPATYCYSEQSPFTSKHLQYEAVCERRWNG
jgi:hypothetical protein